MKIISWNVNGLRAVYKRNFVAWLKNKNADIICLQEIRADESQLAEDIVSHKGYHVYFNSATKKGYSGVAVFTKEKPLKVGSKLGLKRFDSEGRMLRLDFKDFILINIYIPHGGRKKDNLGYKLEAYKALFKYLEKLKGKKVILAGDFNVAHKDIDLARPKQNKDNIMFTEEERKKLDKLVDLGYVDTFRLFEKEEGNYTWWPYMKIASRAEGSSWLEARKAERSRNIGWRIDYIFVSLPLTKRIKQSSILSDDFGSDHCPVEISLK